MATINEISHSHMMKIAVSQISKLESIFTSEVFIHGIPWKVKVMKIEEDNDNKASLAIRLICSNKEKSLKWSISAAISYKLIPFSDEIEPLKDQFKPDVYDRSRLNGIGFHDCIQWDDLFSDGSHFVKDDSIKLEIKIEAENQLNPKRSGVNFECVNKSCESGCLFTFRLTITNVSNLMAIRTPRFDLRGLSWNITVGKDNSSNSLFALLDFEECTKEISCKVMWSIKLLSSKDDAVPVEKIQTEMLHSRDYLIMDDIATWSEIFKPENGFVIHDSITLEIEIKANKPRGNGVVDMPNAKRARLESLNETICPQMECPVCFKCIAGQDLAVTPCGHLFCLACIQKVVNSRPQCPSCSKIVRLNTLRRLYLPIIN